MPSNLELARPWIFNWAKIVLLLIVFSTLVSANQVLADVPTCTVPDKITTFAEKFNVLNYESAISVAPAEDDGIIIAGTTIPPGMMEDADIFITKLNKSGNNVWTKIIQGGPGQAEDEAVKVIKTNPGYLLVGYTLSTATDGDERVLLVKFDEAGNKNWSVILGAGSLNRPVAVTQTSDGGYAVLAQQRLSEEGDLYSQVLYKVNSSGSKQWSKVITSDISSSFYAVADTNDGGIIITATAAINNYGRQSTSFSGLIKLDKNGNIEWSKIMETIPQTLPTTTGTYEDWRWSPAIFKAVEQTSDGSYLAAGQIYSALLTDTNAVGYTSSDLFVTKLDKNGKHKWTESFDFGGIETGLGIIKLNDGYLIFGEHASAQLEKKYILLKINLSGARQWHKLIGSLETGDYAKTSAGGYVVAGVKDNDPYVLKLNSYGDCHENCSLVSTTKVTRHDWTQYVLISRAAPDMKTDSSNSANYNLNISSTTIHPEQICNLEDTSSVPVCLVNKKLKHPNPNHPKTWIAIKYEQTTEIDLTSAKSIKVNDYLQPVFDEVFNNSVKIKDEMIGGLLDYVANRKITRQDVRSVKQLLIAQGFALIDTNGKKQITMSGNGLTLVITFNVNRKDSALIEVTY
ncbi:MAG: hypothetical protein WCW27_02705 [Patescibacteria group bacterium]|jgi:hypothetical protein